MFFELGLLGEVAVFTVVADQILFVLALDVLALLVPVGEGHETASRGFVGALQGEPIDCSGMSRSLMTKQVILTFKLLSATLYNAWKRSQILMQTGDMPLQLVLFGKDFATFRTAKALFLRVCFRH